MGNHLRDPEGIEADKRTNPVNVTCPACGHSWVVAFLPMPIDLFGDLAKAARCAKGCSARPRMGGIRG